MSNNIDKVRPLMNKIKIPTLAIKEENKENINTKNFKGDRNPNVLNIRYNSQLSKNKAMNKFLQDPCELRNNTDNELGVLFYYSFFIKWIRYHIVFFFKSTPI